jgi:hypothetical protein
MVRLKLYKAVIGMRDGTRQLYFIMGAVVGTAEGVVAVVEHECLLALRQLEEQLRHKEQCRESGAALATTLYCSAGACAGGANQT